MGLALVLFSSSVKVERSSSSPSLLRPVDSGKGPTAFLLCAVQAHIHSELTLAAAGCAAVAVWLAATALYVTQCSRPLCYLVLCTFDFWMLSFWIAVSALCSVRQYGITGYEDPPTIQSMVVVPHVLWIVVSQLFVLFVDACPTLSRRSKVVLCLATAILNAYRYIDWFIAVRTDAAMASATLSLVTFDLHLATAAQSAGTALFAYSLRLAFRYLGRTLDLALIDFPVNMVPHHKMEGEGIWGGAAEGASRDSPGPRDAPSGYSTMPRNAPSLENSKAQTDECLETESPRPPNAKALRVRPSSLLQTDGRIRLHVEGALPCSSSRAAEIERSIVEEARGSSSRAATFVLHNCTSFDLDRRTFYPTEYLRTFSPKPLIPWVAAFRSLNSRHWARLCLVCVGAGAVAQLLVGMLIDSYVLMSATQSFLLTIAVIQLCFGVSTRMVRYVVGTLDFWYVITVFTSEIIAGVYLYSTVYNTALVVVHTLMVASSALFIATIDCIALASFDRTIKGLCGLMIGAYTLVDMVILTPAAVRAHPDTYNHSIDLYLTVLNPGSIAELAGFATFLLFIRVASRTLLMKSHFVFFQFGAREEEVPSSDAVVVAATSKMRFSMTMRPESVPSTLTTFVGAGSLPLQTMWGSPTAGGPGRHDGNPPYLWSPTESSADGSKRSLMPPSFRDIEGVT